MKLKTDRKIGAIITLVALFTIVAFAGIFTWKNFLGDADGPRTPVTVDISKGMNATEIGNLLQEKEVVKSALVFRFIVSRQGIESDLKPGKYELKTSMNYDEVIEIIKKGPKIKYIDITLPEGWTAWQMADRVENLTKVDRREYLQAATTKRAEMDYPFLKDNGSDTESLEGYLFPETYKVKEGITAEGLIKVQLDQFQKATASLVWDKAKALGRTPYEIIVVASLIERETVVDAERPLVASVIYNRLRKGMLLQIDATVQYALPKWKDRLLNDDLKIDSPYNTYKHKGLPPGPICNPGCASIEAALNPASTEYLYYVLESDNSGRHVFTETYNEFLNARNRYFKSRK